MNFIVSVLSETLRVLYPMAGAPKLSSLPLRVFEAKKLECLKPSVSLTVERMPFASQALLEFIKKLPESGPQNRKNLLFMVLWLMSDSESIRVEAQGWVGG